jgi:hypothetical protein
MFPGQLIILGDPGLRWYLRGAGLAVPVTFRYTSHKAGQYPAGGPMKDTRTRVDLRLEPDLAEWLAKAAKREDRSLNNYIAHVLAQHVADSLEGLPSRRKGEDGAALDAGHE